MRLAATARSTTDRWLDGVWSRARTTWQRTDEWWAGQPFLRHRLPLLLAIVVTVAYFVVFVRLSWLRHANFGSFDYDLGMYDQGIWQLAHGRNFMTIRGMDLFAHHANIGYLLFVPAYWLGAGPQFLDVVNTLAVVAVAWPVYLLGRVQMSSRWAGFWMVIIYLGHFSPQWKIQETFHPESLAAPFIVGAFYLATQGRWRWYWWCILGALIWKEDVALVIIVLGVVVMFLFHERRRGLLTTLAGVVWFLAATKLFMPIFQDSGAVFDSLFGPLGANMNEVVWNSIRHPTMLGQALYEHEAKQGALDLMAPYGYASVVSPHLLALGAPQHVINFASVQNFTWDLRWHYAFFPYIAVLLASIQTVVTRKRLFISWALIFVMVGGVYLTREQGVGPWAPMNYNAGYWPHQDSPRNVAIRQLMQAIPDDAAVSTLYYIVPHLSHRQQIYTFPNPWRSSNYGVDGVPAPPDPSVVDYLFVDENQVCPPETTPEPPDCGLYRTIVDSDEFEVIAEVDSLKLWKRATP